VQHRRGFCHKSFIVSVSIEKSADEPAKDTAGTKQCAYNKKRKRLRKQQAHRNYHCSDCQPKQAFLWCKLHFRSPFRPRCCLVRRPDSRRETRGQATARRGRKNKEHRRNHAHRRPARALRNVKAKRCSLYSLRKRPQLCAKKLRCSL
jgi:hypothetical protein